MGIKLCVTACRLNDVSNLTRFPWSSLNCTRQLKPNEDADELTSAMATTVNGTLGSRGIPVNFKPSSQLNHEGSEPGGEWNCGLRVSEGHCGSQIFGSHSYTSLTCLKAGYQHSAGLRDPGSRCAGVMRHGRLRCTHANAWGCPMILRLNGLNTQVPLGNRFASMFQI